MTILQAECPIAKAIVEIAELISRNATFLERCRLESGDEGLRKHIHYPELFDPDQEVRPFVVIAPPDGGEFAMLRDSDDTMRFDGQLVLGIGDSYDEETNGRDPLIDFMNFRWAIISAIRDSSGVDDNTVYQAIRAVTPPLRSDREVTGGGAQKAYCDQWFILELGPRA